MCVIHCLFVQAGDREATLQSEVAELREVLEAAEERGADLSQRMDAATDQIAEMERQADVQVCRASTAEGSGVFGWLRQERGITACSGSSRRLSGDRTFSEMVDCLSDAIRRQRLWAGLRRRSKPRRSRAVTVDCNLKWLTES